MSAAYQIHDDVAVITLDNHTSTLDLDRIAAVTARPQDVIGLHFFSPAHVMKLLEIVRGAATGKDVLATALAFSKKLKTTGVVAGVCDGFDGNPWPPSTSMRAATTVKHGRRPRCSRGRRPGARRSTAECAQRKALAASRVRPMLG
jgi:hypothetical protein